MPAAGVRAAAAEHASTYCECSAAAFSAAAVLISLPFILLWRCGIPWRRGKVVIIRLKVVGSKEAGSGVARVTDTRLDVQAACRRASRVRAVADWGWWGGVVWRGGWDRVV